jgi:hypothetical protein
MNEADMMKAHLVYARKRGKPVMPILHGEEKYEVDSRGFVTFGRFTGTITIDYCDLFAYWTPSRPVQYCEGSSYQLMKLYALIAPS